MGWGEVVEEETWYGADGEVVKTVKRTYSGADHPVARPTWEPSWVVRDREQAKRRSSSSSRYRSYGRSSRSYGYSYYTPVYYRPSYRNYCGSYGRRSHHGGTTGWRVRAGHGRLLIGYSN